MNRVRETVHSAQFRMNIINASRNVLEKLLGSVLEDSTEVAFPRRFRQSCVAFEGIVDGHIYASFAPELLDQLGKQMLAGLPQESNTFDSVHILWETLNTLAGAIIVAMDEMGIDVNLGSVRPLGRRLQPHDLADAVQTFAFRHTAGAVEIALLIDLPGS